MQHLVNEAPTDIDLTSSSVAENAPSGTAVGAFSTTDADAGDTHTYALVAGAGDTDNGSFTIAGTSLNTAAMFDRETKASYSIRVRTTDSGTPGLTYEEQFTIQVANVNEAPVLDPVGNRHVDEGSSLQFTVSAWDPEDRPLSYTASDLPGGAVFVDQEFRWAPTYEQAGTYPVTFTVSDGEETDSESITITVEDVNRSPLISAMTDTTMSEGDSFTRQVDAADADGDTVRYSLVSGPRGMTIGAGTGEIAFTAGYTQSGTYAVTVKAEDGVDGEDTETFSVTVLNVDRPCSTLTVSLEDGMKHEVRIPGNTSCITLYGEDGTFLSIDFMSGDVANRTLTVTRHMGIGDRFPGIPGFEDGVYYYDMSSDVDAFSGNLTFGYSDAQVAELGIDEGHLAVGFYDSTDTRGMIWHAVPAIVDEEENTLTVPIDRFCLWGVTSREESLLSGIVEDEITSSSLAGNLLGDPTTRKMNIYFPPSYDTEPDRRYPVVYLLHGYLWNHTCFTGGMNAFFEEMTGEDLGIDLADVAGSGIAAGALDEMIIVMPDALNAYGGSWYERSPVIGDYRGYIAQELVSYMDGKYRTIPDRDSRGIAGHSMGGYGALSLAIEYSDVFGAVAGLSPGTAVEVSPTFIDRFITENPDTLGHPVILPAAPATWADAEYVFQNNYNTNIFYSIAAVYSPNPDHPPYYVDLPVQYPEKTVVQEVWDKWVEGDLVHQIARDGANLSQTWIFVDVGVGPVGIMSERPDVTARVLSALDAQGILYTYEEFPGDHLTHLRHQISSGLEFLSDHLATEEEIPIVHPGYVRAVDNLPPAPVTDLMAEDTPDDAGGSITLTWTASADDKVVGVYAYAGYMHTVHGVAKYNIYRRTEHTGYAFLGSVDAGATSYVDDTAVDGVTYTYIVCAADRENEPPGTAASAAARNNLAPVDENGEEIEGLLGEDNSVGMDDFLLFAPTYGKTSEDVGFEERCDFDGDGIVGMSDFLIFVANYGKIAVKF